MKLSISTACLALFLASDACAFSPQAFAVKTPMFSFTQTRTSTFLFAKSDDMSLDEEVDMLVKEELQKEKKFSNLRDANGREYAPWMGITEDDEKRIRQLVLEKTVARRRRQEEQKDFVGALSTDSQAQELSGSGLRWKVMNGNDVELEWSTNSETSTRGFIVKRRPAKTEGFKVIASYDTFAPLVSKGTAGGLYRYLDENVTPGGWVYRVTECEANGNENDLSQCLVDIQTSEEQKGTLLAVGAIGVVAIAALAAGFLLDPVQY